MQVKYINSFKLLFDRNGQQQSPIRIKLSSNYHIEPFRIDIDYHEPEEDFIELLNDGLKLFVKGSFGALQYGDHLFQTSEIHLHHPSEHTVFYFFIFIFENNYF